MKYEILLFDVDNTLLDFDANEAESFKNMIEDKGQVYSEELYSRYKEINHEMWKAVECGEMTIDEIVNLRFEKLMDLYGKKVDGEDYEKTYRSYLNKGVQEMPKVHEVLSKLKGKYKLYVITNGVGTTQDFRMKGSGLDKYFENSDDLDANVVIKVRGKEQKIEITVPAMHYTLRSEESHSDLYAAIDLTVDKLERQIRKNKTKINSRIKRNVIQNFEMDLEDNFEEDNSVVLKRKKIDMKPMDEEEAILQMNMLGHSFFVFKNADTDSICVLYLRKDGNYGIIETN